MSPIIAHNKYIIKQKVLILVRFVGDAYYVGTKN